MEQVRGDAVMPCVKDKQRSFTWQFHNYSFKVVPCLSGNSRIKSQHKSHL